MVRECNITRSHNKHITLQIENRTMKKECNLSSSN